MNYAIIYWVGDDEVYPYLNEDKTLKLFDRLEEADKYADELENTSRHDREIEARVISIEGVKE
jgi:hypothetical protein